jgi:alkylresorcinol/alkylpyrone synthase
MSFLSSVSAIPAKNNYSLDSVCEAAKLWLHDKPSEYELFQRFHRASGTKNRSYVLSLQEILSLESQAERAMMFVKHGLPLACQAIELSLDKAQLTPKDISSVVFTSCTCPLIPSLDTEILQRMGFAPTVNRIPMYQQGCAGGVVGLSLADRLSKQEGNVLLISVELCSLLFRLKESSTVHLLGSALFADGAAASVVSQRDSGLKFLGAQSYLLPETGHLMGYDIRADGAHLKLDRDLPAMLQDSLKKVVDQFLSSLGLKQSDFPWWVIHPGGVKILDGVANLLELKEEQYKWSYDVLSKVGNMSSATVQFVLSDCIASGVVEQKDRVMMIGIGPGLTVELIAFENA